MKVKAPTPAQLQAWTPLAGYVLVGILIILAAKRLLKIIPDAGGIGQGLEDAREGEENAQVDIVTGSGFNAENLTRPPAFYHAIAQRQYDAMNQWGTDKSELFDSLEGLNPDELNAVFQAFGLRASTVFWGAYGITKRRNIIQWYKAELSGRALTRMQEIWSVTPYWN